MRDLITELSDQIASVIDGYYAGAIPEIVAPVKAEIERLEAQLVRKDKKIERLVRDRFVMERELEKRR